MEILNIKDLYYRANNIDIINGISIDVIEGDCISVVGSSGSGKSTLLKLCADLIPITTGNINYRGLSYSTYNPIELRRKISYCIQIPVLFGKDVWQNLEFPFKVRKSIIEKGRIEGLMREFNLDKDILGKNIDSLSGGEKQRIAIIRNLMFVPDILLLDEATSALDKANADVVENYIRELNKSGTTVIWITHSMDQSTGIFNKRVTIQNGKILKMEMIK